MTENIFIINVINTSYWTQDAFVWNFCNVRKLMPFSYSIATICHPPYIKFLVEHLMSIKNALKGRKPEVVLLVSRASDLDRIEIEKLLSTVSLSCLKTIYTHEPLTIGQARNNLFANTKSDWVAFLDCDTVMDIDYIDNLESYLKNTDLQGVGAMGGNILPYKCSPVGFYEALMDITALIGKVSANKKDFFEFFKGFSKSLTHNVSEDLFLKQLKQNTITLDKMEMSYLQGFNQIINRHIYLTFGGFDDRFISAEDRDIAANVLVNKLKVIFLAKCIMKHHYPFSYLDIFRRKKIHGLWSQLFRKKYLNYPNIVPQYNFFKWLRYFSLIFRTPAPFNNSMCGRCYYFIAFFGYSFGCLKSINSKYNIKSL